MITVEEIDGFEQNVEGLTPNERLSLHRICAAARLQVSGQAASEGFAGLSEKHQPTTIRDEPIAEEAVWDGEFWRKPAPPPSSVLEHELAGWRERALRAEAQLSEANEKLSRLPIDWDTEIDAFARRNAALEKENGGLKAALRLARSCINEGGTAEAVAWCLKQIDAALTPASKEGE